MAMEKEIEVLGKPPNKDDKFWIDVASKITPDKSIERLDTHGKYLFSTVSIVGTLLTGFGIFSPMGTTILRNPLIFLPVALASLSLALAMMGITPKTHKLYLQDINSVRNYYNHLIHQRGLFIFWAGVAFSLSLLTVAIVTAVSLKPMPLTPTISVRLIGTGEKTMLTTKIELQEVPRSGTAEIQIVGYEETKKGPEQSILFKETTRADQTGKMTVSAELDKLGKYKWFMITSKVVSGTEILCEKKVEVRR
jgi:hypothetical protein